ncbi:MAG: cupredoxin domain-containing protein [bacterium]
MNKNYIIGLVVIVLLVGAFVMFGTDKKVEAPVSSAPEETTQTPAPVKPATVTVTPPITTTAPVKEFTVTGSNYSFTPSTMTVKKGDKVKITFKNMNGFHDFKIDEFNVATAKIQGGAEATVEFVADKAGSFQYYCSVGSHRANGMWGTLVVQS